MDIEIQEHLLTLRKKAQENGHLTDEELSKAIKLMRETRMEAALAPTKAKRTKKPEIDLSADEIFKGLGL